MMNTNVYNWHEDIQPIICEAMGIDERFFRAYHDYKYTDGAYADFWHFCLDALFPEGISNDTIVKLYVDGWDEPDVFDYFTDPDGKLRYGEWVKDIRPGLIALQELAKKNADGDEKTADQLYIQFSW